MKAFNQVLCAVVFGLGVMPAGADEDWMPLGTGVNSNVHALVVSGHDLYVGGNFTMAGDAPANLIAKWDGSNWNSLGLGLGGGNYRDSLVVRTLAVLSNNVFAGGNFLFATNSNQVVLDVNNTARWDGISWNALGTGLPSSVLQGKLLSRVSSLAILEGQIYAGSPGSPYNYNLLRWTGAIWAGDFFSFAGANGIPALLVLIESGNSLYAGGGFLTPDGGGLSGHHVAALTGSGWNVLGAGMNSNVTALAGMGTTIYAGGNFTTVTNVGGVPITVNRIAKWDGNTWTPLGTGMNGPVYALVVSGTNLYAGGGFTMAGDVPANRIARWDGNAWSAVGTGMNSNVLALVLSGNDLYAGGEFTAAGGVPANHIAKLALAAIPLIAAQPQSRTNEVGETATFTVSATGSAPLAYQWRKDGMVLGWAAMATLSLTNVQSSDVGDYIVVVTNNYGSVTSSVATLTVSVPGLPPEITTQPESRTNLVGTLATFMVSASGTAPLAYQWRKGGVTLTNETNPALALADVQTGAIGHYDAVVTNSYGSVTSAVANLTVVAPPAIATQPQSRTNSTGTTATFTVSATGTAPLAYQWHKDSGVLSGATADSLSLNNLQPGDSGNYYVVITNNYGSVTSVVATLTVVTPPSESGWSALGGGMNDTVWALAVSGTDVYVGGEFTWATNSGGVAVAANYVAKWNGSSWSALGTGMDSIVTSLAVAGSNLYAGGLFMTAGGTTAYFIAKWNGSSWSALGTGMDNFVWALAATGDDVYAGGEFMTADGMAVNNRIAKWNGSSWSTLGGGMNDIVLALAGSGSDLYAGGYFVLAGGAPAAFNAKWDGGGWSVLGIGTDSWVEALAVAGNDLYVGGQFATAGGVTANKIAKWDGNNWSALGTGVNNRVLALAAAGNDLYAGGTFTMAGGVARSRIAKWNGSWSGLGTGVNGTVRALTVSGNDVYAGGAFTTAGGVLVNRIAKWKESIEVPPLIFSHSGMGTSNNIFQALLAGPNGAVVVLEGSTNLLHWTPVETNTLSTGGLPLSLPINQSGRQFYRARFQP